MGRLEGKRALITGGTTGIGLATAKLFMAEGARVVLTGKDPARLRTAAAELGGGAVMIASDAGDPKAALSLSDQLRSELGGLDLAFLNAGVAKFAGLADVTELFFDEIFNVNVKGVLFTIQAVEPLMADGGSIVVNTSVNNQMGMSGTLVYGASKAAARAMVRTLAGELAPRRIRVNAVSPGPVETPIYGKLGMPPEQLQAVASGLAQKIPLARFGRAEEIAQAALFLASDASSFVNGEELVADGGWTGVGG